MMKEDGKHMRVISFKNEKKFSLMGYCTHMFVTQHISVSHHFGFKRFDMASNKQNEINLNKPIESPLLCK